MTLQSPPWALGAAAQVLSGKTLRLAMGAAFRNAAAGVQGVSGVLYGPPNTMGELVLNSNTSLTVRAFRALVQCTQDTTQGQYLVANDADATFTTVTTPAVPVQDATQFRRAYVLAAVADSQVAGVASGALTDRAYLDILAGPLAATAGAATYPAVPPNALLLGELLVPPTGQAVTVTPYNPRTTVRGGILPVLVDGSTTPGHDGAVPLHDGQYRDHPTYGLQRAVGGTWGPTDLSRPVGMLVGSATNVVISNGSWTNIPLPTVRKAYDVNVGTASRIIIQRAGCYQISWACNFAGGSGTNTGRRLGAVYLNGAQAPFTPAGVYPTLTNGLTVAGPATPIQLNANDYLQLFAFADPGASTTIDSTQSFLAATYIGA